MTNTSKPKMAGLFRTQCPVCAERRKKNTEKQRRYRAKKALKK